MKSKAFCFWSFTLLGFPYLLISKLIFLIELFVRFLIYEKVCNFAIHIAINLGFDFYFLRAIDMIQNKKKLNCALCMSLLVHI